MASSHPQRQATRRGTAGGEARTNGLSGGIGSRYVALCALVLLLGLGVLHFGAAGGSATSGWSAATALETNSTVSATNPDIAVDPGGNATAVWLQNTCCYHEDVWGARSAAGQGWASPILLETTDPGDAGQPVVVMDANGNAMVVWQQWAPVASVYNIWYNRYAVGSGWGGAALLETDDTGSATDPDLTVDTGGNVTVVWHQWDGSRFDIDFNRYVVGSASWTGSSILENCVTYSCYLPHVASDSQGDAYAVWLYGDTVDDVRASRYAPSSGWGTSILLDQRTETAQMPRIAADPQGNAIAIWIQNDGTARSLWGSRFASGAWATPQLVEYSNVSDTYNPEIVADATGNFTTTWTQNYNTSSTYVWSNRYDFAKGWGDATLAGSNQPSGPGDPRISTDPYGNVTVVWAAGNDVWSAWFSTEGGWGGAGLTENGSGASNMPDVATDRYGTSVAVWYQLDTQFSVYSSSFKAPGKPSIPLNISARGGNHTVTLSWTVPTDSGGGAIGSYRVFRGGDAVNVSLLINITNMTNLTDSNLTNGVTYFYQISAVSAAGSGPRSAVINATPLTFPASPRNVTAAVGDSQLAILWDPPDDSGGANVTNYTIYRGLTPASLAPIALLANVTNFLDTGLTNGQSYYYAITANNSLGESNRSLVASGTPMTIPSTPYNLSIEVRDGELNLTWHSPSSSGGSNITTFELYRGSTPSALSSYRTALNPFPYNWPEISYFDWGLTNGLQYCYQVSAVNGVGEGNKSGVTCAVPATLPGSPRNLAASSGDNLVNLSWQAPTSDGGNGIGQYRIYRGISPGTGALLNLTTNLSYLDASVTNGRAYSYRVTAENGIGEGPFSLEVNATPRTIPGAPQNLLPSAGNGAILLAWSAPAFDGGIAITGYTVYWGSASGNVSRAIPLGLTYGYTVSGLTNGAQYFFQVVATNVVGESARTAVVSGTPQASIQAPLAPQNLQATPSDGQVRLRWQAPSSDGGSPLTGYQIYRREGAGPWVALPFAGTTPAFDDTDVTNGIHYGYQVSALNGVGEGPRTLEVLATPSGVPMAVPGAPRNLSLTQSVQEISITWLAPVSDGGSQITTYRLYRGLAAAGLSWLLDVGNTLARADSPVGAGTTYFYSISAVNAVGEGPQSLAANITFLGPCARPQAPLNLTAVREGGAIRLRWNPSPIDARCPVLSYRVYRGDSSSTLAFQRAIASGAPTFLDDGGGSGASAFYQLSAVNGAGEGAPSALASVVAAPASLTSSSFFLLTIPIFAALAIVGFVMTRRRKRSQAPLPKRSLTREMDGAAVLEEESGRGSVKVGTVSGVPLTLDPLPKVGTASGVPLTLRPPLARRVVPTETRSSNLPGGFENYTFIERVGSGAFSTVYKARNEREGTLIALKVPRAFEQGTTIENRMLEAFAKEAALWESLTAARVEGVVPLYAHGMHPVPWLAMELMAGGSLRKRLATFSVRESLEIAIAVASTLEAVHARGVIHRDIKPENILFHQSNRPGLADWGTGRVLHRMSTGSAGDFKGTILYSAPEQMAPKRYGPVDAQTDIYQLGVVLYEMLAKRMPNATEESGIPVNQIPDEELEPPSAHNVNVPPALDAIVLKALARDKARRYQSASRLLDDLRRLGG